MMRTWFGRGALFVLAVGLMMYVLAFFGDAASIGVMIPAQDAPPEVVKREARQRAQATKEIAASYARARNVTLVGLVLIAAAWANAKRRRV